MGVAKEEATKAEEIKVAAEEVTKAEEVKVAAEEVTEAEAARMVVHRGGITGVVKRKEVVSHPVKPTLRKNVNLV